jgi:hypothetical protein
VDETRVVSMQMVEGSGGLCDVVEDPGELESGFSVLIEEPTEVDALDPIHHDHVSVVVLEIQILSDRRQSGMGLHAQERAGLSENVLVCLRPDLLVDLQRNEPSVPPITGSKQ